MKKQLLLVAGLATLVFASCNKEQNIIQPDENLVEITIAAGADSTATKTQISGDKVNWETTDKIGVYDNTSTLREFTIDAESISGPSASFTGEVAQGTETLYAVYPYDAAAGISSGVISATLPKTQVIGEGLNVAHGALLSVAKGTKESLGFKNVFSLLKVNVTYSDIVSIVVNGTSLAGTASIDPETGVVSSVTAGGNTITVTYKDGETAFPKGDYYIAVLPGTTAANNFSVAMTRKDSGLSCNKVATKAVTLARNGGLDFGSLDTKVDWFFNIYDKATLKQFLANSKKYKSTDKALVTADIDFGGETTEPSQRFYGTLDGQNHRIYNIVVASDSTKVGLIGELGDTMADSTGTVKNLCVGSSDYDFSTKTGTWDGVSTITNKCAKSDSWGYAGLIAYTGFKTTIENVANFASVKLGEGFQAKYRVGGITGTMKPNATIKNCVNAGTVTATVPSNITCGDNGSVGGVVGYIDGANCLIENCINKGAVTAGALNFYSAGGILGLMNTASKVKDCENNGAVNVTLLNATAKEAFVGGIVGCLTVANTEITGCTNKGNVTISGSTTQMIAEGGICGGLYGGVNKTFTNCTNYGDVINNAACTQKGGTAPKLKGVRIGGVLGSTHQKVVLSGCKNGDETHKPTISNTGAGAVVCLGGILGYNQSADANCSGTKNYGTVQNSGVITTDLYIGGIIGQETAFTGTATGCENHGNLSNSGNLNAIHLYIGGIAGQVVGTASAGGTYKSCVNRGNLNNAGVSTLQHSTPAVTSFDPGIYMGGIFGCVRGAFKIGTGNADYCSNYGNITNASNSKSVALGGIFAHNNSAANVSVQYAQNHGTITNTQTAAITSLRLGGIVGSANQIAKVEHCLNASDAGIVLNGLSNGVNTSLNVGGVLGGSQANVDLNYCTNEAAFSVADFKGGQSYIGGVSGLTNLTSRTYTGNENHANISVDYKTPTSTAYYYFGGVHANGGNSGVAFIDCKNSGNLTFASAAKSDFACVASTFSANSSGCENTGNAFVTNNVNATDTGTGIWVGGLFAWNHAAATLTNCKSRGNITVTANGTSWTMAGGLMGRPAANLTLAGCSYGGTITNNQATGHAAANVSGPFVGAFDSSGKTLTLSGSDNKVIAGTNVNGTTYTAGTTLDTNTQLCGKWNAPTMTGTASVVNE